MVNKRDYYKRQIILGEVGEAGQEKLNNSKVIVIGAGGLGSPLLNYLVSAGVGHIGIYDFDTVEETNLHRQTLFSPLDIGKNKATVAKNILSTKNPLIKITANPQRFDHDTKLKDVDIVIDCTDNFKTKFLVHDICFEKKISFCIASIHKFEGQVQFFNFKDQTGCMRCLWEESPSKDSVQTCGEAGVLGATAGIIGSIQAMETIKHILNLQHLKNNENLIINLLDFQTFKLKIPKNNNCPLCGNVKRESASPDRNFEISIKDAKKNKFFIINLTDISKLDYTKMNSSFSNIEKDILILNKEEKIAILCNQGITSLQAVKKLRELGYKNTFSIEDGLRGVTS
ncbi:MAG: adenylyltransferase/sulfurtransferase [Bacteriovoracaceae bacterium]|jgi:molybdopterin/thiamine biosynthesis adenylyltransferase